MNKKLLAVAVAGALAAPGVAMAQASSVTISGIFKVGVNYDNYSSVPVLAGGLSTRLNSAQARVVDNSSRILFNVTEDLGNGLDAVAQIDMRFAPDVGTLSSGGNTWVGLASKSWGRVTLGRHDLHYGKQPDDTAAKAGALMGSAVSLMDYINGMAIAGATRTQNVVRYDMPTWMGLDAIVAWSGNAGNAVGGNTNEQDMSVSNAAGVSTRTGNAWNINPSYTNGPFNIGYSYWRSKPDAPIASTATTTGTLDQRGDVLYGSYKYGGFKLGLAWNKSSLDFATTGASFLERTAWSLPMSYVTGPHNFVGHYTRANGMSNAAGTVLNSSARMFAVAYVYDLSKRTSVGLTYAKINNDINASYNFFTSASLGSADVGGNAVQGTLGQGLQGGESPRMLQGTVRHAF